ncbi:MAG: glycosyltransferase family 2 protein [Selenomonas sp.]|nr:glycosyltransferase family 2 protein [Selenomonas sp.]
MKIQVIIPVYNPDRRFVLLLEMLQRQSLGKLPVLIVDSGQEHGYRERLTGNEAFTIKYIPNSEFNHGGTRQMGMEMFPDKDVYVFLTQDALLGDEYAIERLVACFEDSTIGCAYGRQLPYDDASIFAQLARRHNYGESSYVRSWDDRGAYGMKTCFLSNSFAAYRREAMFAAGGCPTNTILGEDIFVAAKMLMADWKVAFAADACVYHSHNYTVWQEFKRYFDIGVFHAREQWIRDTYGQAEGAGLKFLKMEIKTLWHTAPHKLVEMVIRDGMKYIGYQLGLHEKWMPKCVKKYISMTKSYWM